MDSEEIRRRWVPEVGPAPTDGKSWDARAAMFDIPVPGEDDPYIALLLREGRPDPQWTDVLDIGCGTGAHSLALRRHVRSVRGLDVAAGMIALANRKAAALGAANAAYEVADWTAQDARRLGHYGLVMAHMTPAICSAATFAKMLAVADGMCFLTGYISRENPIWDEIYRITGRDGRTESDKLLYAQDTLWQLGREPRLFYERVHRAKDLTPAEAAATYLDGARSFTALTPAQERAIADLLAANTVDGRFHDVSDPLIGTLYWDMADRSDGD